MTTGFEDLYEMLGNLLYNAVYTLLYPFIYFITIVLNAITNFFNSLIRVITSITGLGESLISMLKNLLTLIFPDVWTTLILTGITIIILLRIYSFIRGSKV